MSSAALTAFRAELLAQLEVLNPILEGLEELSKHEMSEEAHSAVNHQITRYHRRIDMINQSLRDLDSLEGDGYPEMPDEEVSPEIKKELEHEAEVIVAALDAFSTNSPATALNLQFQEPELKE